MEELKLIKKEQGTVWQVEFEWDPNFNRRCTGRLYKYPYSYKASDPEESLILNPEDKDLMFDFSVCWRGCWEDRLYFVDGEEYWCGDLREMADAWDEFLPMIQEKIKQNSPPVNEYDYVD